MTKFYIVVHPNGGADLHANADSIKRHLRRIPKAAKVYGFDAELLHEGESDDDGTEIDDVIADYERPKRSAKTAPTE